MNDLKILLAAILGLGMSLSFVGCDADDEDGGDGGIEDDGGAGGEGGGAGEPYSYVTIVDNSEVENMAGTPGVDICGVLVNCDGVDYLGTSAQLAEGTGEICSEIGDDCSANRADPAAAEDGGNECDATSAPDSDYVSTGVGGILTLQFTDDEGNAIDLRGCEVTVTELAGRDTESYELHVCTMSGVDEIGTCELIGTADDGGATTIPVPETVGIADDIDGEGEGEGEGDE